ncbi:MAG: nucleoside-diphosphate kinase [Patescibacteria group bacterium]|nr:MAG: nucleoside-diphosphate kinase [Patescibacteria group bacterium]
MTHPTKERTLVIIKPDGVQRSLVGDLIKRLEGTGLKIVAMKMFVPTREQTLTHYNKDGAWCESVGKRTVENIEKDGGKPEKSALEYGKDILEGNVGFMTCSPVVAIVLEGNKAIGIVKKLVGGTEPLTSDVGTIRGDLTIDSYELANFDGRAVRNLIHCTDPEDGQEEAEREINVWFKDGEIIRYKHVNEKMLYDINLDGILE